MQRKLLITYFLILITLLAIMSLSHPTSERIRGGFVAFLFPLWEKMFAFKHFLSHPSHPSPFSSLSKEEEIQRLQLENHLLTNELANLHHLLEEQMLLFSQLKQLAVSSPEVMHQLDSDNSKETLHMILKQLKWRLKAIPARVIFRPFDTWNSSLWINVGESANRIDHPVVVAKNSPVVLGRAIVGVIDYVGKHQSRVRLVTDSRLTPSVRAARGGEQDLLISESIERLLQQLNRQKTRDLSSDDSASLVRLLQQVKQTLWPLKKSWYLAKGELLGSSVSSRRGQGGRLKGIGFNYDFADEEGEGRDLRTGRPLQDLNEQAIPILKINDILVTTGMDGIFPPGFQVAIVSHVEWLKEGDYFYELEAKPILGSLEELSLVFVLPPFSEEE